MTTTWLMKALGSFCVDCAVYYGLGRRRAAGSQKQPPAGMDHGMRLSPVRVESRPSWRGPGRWR
jgi:hypothetical protein